MSTSEAHSESHCFSFLMITAAEMICPGLISNSNGREHKAEGQGSIRSHTQCWLVSGLVLQARDSLSFLHVSKERCMKPLETEKCYTIFLDIIG